MKNKTILSFKKIALIIGSLFLLIAIGSLLYISISSSTAIKKSEKIITAIEQLFPDPVDSFSEERGNNMMASVQLEKINVAGVIEMPQYDLKLPFCSSWGEKNQLLFPHVSTEAYTTHHL